ncbi:MAG: hypothetical protein ACM3UZ_09635 [Acidobacteriota bacterium]
MGWHRVPVVWVVLIFMFMSGCSGIREIETNGDLKQDEQMVFVSEEQAIQTVRNSLAVGSSYVFITEHFPSENQPVFVIRAAQDAGDHLHAMKSFTIDAIDSSLVSIDE